MDLIQSINEKRNTFSADTFRPSESQKSVLLVMDQTSDRTVKKADVTSSSNEQKAFDALVDLELIDVDDDERATLTSAGNAVVENIKAADPSLAGEEDMDTEEDMPMEKFELLKSINTTLVESTQLEEMQKMSFSADDVKFLELFRDDKAEINDNPKLVEKLMDFYADEVPYGIVTGDEGTPDEWIMDHIDRIIDDVKSAIKKK